MKWGYPQPAPLQTFEGKPSGSFVANLILVPTPIEHAALAPRLKANLGREWSVQRCGFGPIAAAARCAALLARYQPERVLLIGIGGTFVPERHPVGSACRFEQVVCYGVGVGTGSEYQGVDDLGWQHFSAGQSPASDGDVPRIGDVIRLTSTYVGNAPLAGQLLTACAASSNAADVTQRLSRFPEAVAEDMEGFGVAMACEMASVPLQIVRGISNVVGDRDRERWQIDEALHAAFDLALEIMPWRWIPTNR